MTETGNIDTSSGVAVGVSSQANSQQTNVYLSGLLEQEPKTIREQVRALWLMALDDQLHRRERQAYIDRQFKLMTIAIVVLAIGLLLEIAALVVIGVLR